MSDNYNSQAFPVIGTHEQVIEVGMTLRDYFAAKAMQMLITKDEDDGFDPDLSTEVAAAIRARGKA